MHDVLEEITTRACDHATDKEKEFLGSARKYLDSKGFLTSGQKNWLNTISEKYSHEKISEISAWKDNWSQEHRNIAIQVAHYYKENPPYFSRQVHTILSDPDNFVLSKREWDKFCENKYAKKIRNEYDSVEKFKVGECIQIRKTNKIGAANYNIDNAITVPRIAKFPTDDVVGFVLAVNSKPITRAAKGSRIYSILLSGCTSPVYAHESDLKKMRKSKR